MDIIRQLRDKIEPADNRMMELSRQRWNQIGKPLHSLGKLEIQITRIAGVRRKVHFSLDKKALIVMCADNGVVEAGVTQTGQEVTAIVAKNFQDGRTCTNQMASLAGVEIFPIDIGIARDVDGLTVSERKVVNGTKNFAKEPAMTRKELLKAIQIGIDIVREKKEQGYDILLTGEMGIGNTTTSSAVSAAILGKDPEVMTGRGAGLDQAGLDRKKKVIRDAIAKYKLQGSKDTLHIMECVGGLDIAGLCGIFLGGALYRIPVVLDGFISATAALCAARLVPQAVDAMVPSHISKEPAAGLILKELGLSPLLTCDMSLGEGSGAVALMPILDMGHKVYEQMNTFEEIKVEQYEELE